MLGGVISGQWLEVCYDGFSARVSLLLLLSFGLNGVSLESPDTICKSAVALDAGGQPSVRPATEFRFRVGR